jgi:hypothetical protein
LSKSNWDTLAEAVRWSRAHSETLQDTHWIGGNPDKLQVYGWAAWSPAAGIVTLRNPSSKVQHFSVGLRRIFELRGHTAIAYKLHNAWSDAKPGGFETIQTGKPFDLALAPFEVLTLEADPLRGNP